MLSTTLFLTFLTAPMPAAPVSVNTGPTCSAGPDVTLSRQGDQTTVVLDGSLSFDPDGDPLTFTWTTGCPGAVLGDPSAPVTTLTLTTPVNQTVSCSVRLKVGDGQENSFCRFYVNVTPGPIQLPLDIRPGCCPNTIDTKKCLVGIVEIALVANGSFDPDDVDRDTLELVRADSVGNAVCPLWTKECDVATPFDGDLCDCHTLKCDGVKDLVMKFSGTWMAYAFDLDHEKDKTNVRLVLRGRFEDGSEFEASDCVRVLTKNK